MYQVSTNGGRFWISKDGVRWHDWRGRQAYKYRFGGARNNAS